MAKNYTTTSTVSLQVNAKQASQMLDKLKKDTANLEKQFQKAEKAGDKVTMKNLRKSIKENQRLMKLLTTETAQATEVLQRLDKATPKELNRTLKQLRNELNNIPRGSKVWNEHVEKIKQVKQEIQNLNEEMNPDQSLWDRVKGFWDDFQLEITAGVASIAGLIAAGRSAVKSYAEMQQEMANVQKFTGMNEGEVLQLNEYFKQIDTRTSREDLNKYAQEAGRLGKSRVEDVLGYVRAADKINVALDDLGEGATLTLSKLTGIFGDEERLGTEKALLSVGSVINELSQNCSASGTYLTEFASRMGGVGAQAGLTVQQIMAYASVLDANNQALEQSATAMSQLIVRMYQDPSKYAKVAGLDVQKFSKLLKEDANEAIIQFLEALNKAGKMDVLSVMFKDMGEKGSGMVAALSTLAGKIEMVKDQQLVANEAFREAVSIDNEFNVQNNTILAGFDKSKKALKEIAVDLGQKLQPVMSLCFSSSTVLLKTLSKLVDFLFKNRTEIIILTSSVAAYCVVANLAIIRTKAVATAQMLWNKAIAVSKIPAFRLMISGLTNAYQYLANGLRVSYEMQERWRKSMGAMNLANWAGLILTVAAALVILAKKTYDAYKEQARLREERNKFAKEAEDISKKAVDNYSKEISALKRLFSAAIDEAKSKDERLEAAKRLQQLYPSQFANMSTEEIMLGKAKSAYDNLTRSIINNAKAKAAAEKVLENEKKILDLEGEIDEEWKKKREASAERDKIRAYNKNVNTKASSTAESFTGAIAMQAGGTQEMYEQKSTKAADAKVYEAAKNIREKSEQKKVLSEANDKLTNRFKNNPAFKNTLSEADSEGTETPSFTGYTHVETDKERRKREAEARKAQAEARRNEIKARKEFKDELKKIQGDRDKAEAEAKVSRNIGAIDYLEYIEQMRKAEIEYFDSSLKLYEDHNLQEDADYKALLEKKADADEKYRNQKLVLDKEATEREYKVKEQEENARYNALRNTSLQDEMEHSLNLYSLQVQKLIDLRSLYEKGSKEWYDYDLKLKEASTAEQEKRQKMFMAKVSEYQKEFDKLTVAEKYKLEREALKTLYDMKYINEKEYRDWLEKLNKKEKKDREEEKDALPGVVNMNTSKNAGKEAERKFKEQKELLDQALASDVIDEKEYKARLERIKGDMYDSLIAPLKDSKSEWVSLMTSMADAWMDFAKALNDPDGDPLDGLTKGLEATVAVMGAVMSQITEFTKAEMQIQTAAIEKRYDREIAFAEGNSYLTKKFEKEKQEEIAKIKEEAANKEFAMQVIGAVAQTAANAISAYGAALKVGPAGLILAPIAAGLAVAQGVVQVASIRKQKEAAAATGYSKGGFTKPGDVDEPAGVVHAGEWVASQKLVKSPVARPIIDMLEYAQRTNRIGSLSMEDVSRSISAPMRIASMAQQPVVVQAPASAPVASGQAGEGLSQGDLAASLDKLNSRLENPIVAVSSVAGEFGSKRAEEKYNRMMRNKSPRKRS